VLQGFDFGAVADQDVGIARVVIGVVLVVVLGVIEAFERRDFSDDFGGEDVGRVELGDVGLGDALLFGAGVENCRPVGGATSGPGG